MAAEMKYQGVGTRGKHCVVYVDVVVGGVKYAREVLVPWGEFARDEMQYEVNLAVVQRLRALWEGQPPPWQVDDALPGIG